MFIQKQDQKMSPAKVAGRIDTAPANFYPIFGGWRMLIPSPGGRTCGIGMSCSGQVLPVWEHKDLKSCYKIRCPTPEKSGTCS